MKDLDLGAGHLKIWKLPQCACQEAGACVMHWHSVVAASSRVHLVGKMSISQSSTVISLFLAQQCSSVGFPSRFLLSSRAVLELSFPLL